MDSWEITLGVSSYWLKLRNFKKIETTKVGVIVEVSEKLVIVFNKFYF